MDELDELRLKIAEAMGWTFWDSLDKLGPWAIKGNPSSASYAGGIPLYKIDNPDAGKVTWREEHPDWPRDIAAAWELVEQIADNGDIFIEYWQDGEWFIANHPLGINPRELGSCDGRTTGKRNICLAICRAWLAWWEATGEK